LVTTLSKTSVGYNPLDGRVRMLSWQLPCSQRYNPYAVGPTNVAKV